MKFPVPAKTSGRKKTEARGRALMPNTRLVNKPGEGGVTSGAKLGSVKKRENCNSHVTCHSGGKNFGHRDGGRVFEHPERHRPGDGCNCEANQRLRQRNGTAGDPE